MTDDREVVALREGAKAGGHPGKEEELVLAELRLDNAWRELYEFMDLPLSRESGTDTGTECLCGGGEPRRPDFDVRPSKVCPRYGP